MAAKHQEATDATVGDQPGDSGSDRSRFADLIEKEVEATFSLDERLDRIDALIGIKIVQNLSKEDASPAEIKVAMDYLKLVDYEFTSLKGRAKSKGKDAGEASLDDLVNLTLIPQESLGEHPVEWGADA